MSDEAFSLWMALTCLALIVVLWLQFSRARIMRRLLRSLEESEAKKKEASQSGGEDT
ncbi:MAG TPA: hypothetical protein VMU84_04265 [Thermoanaerobaculia bacterium]|nr:hypothetical protein [Thermoanaerobaculia bacterium]